jgi:hypothetical protein
MTVTSPTRRLQFPQPVRLLLGTLAAFLVFWVYGKLHFYRDPGSLLFFDPSRAYERRYSAYRLNEVLGYRKEITKKIQSKRIAETPAKIKDPEVCAVIVSVDRKINGLDIHPLEVRIHLYLRISLTVVRFLGITSG